MDLTKYSIVELKKMRDSYRKDLTALKHELKIVSAAMNNSEDDAENTFRTRYSKSSEVTDNDEIKVQELLQAVTQIKHLDITMERIQNEGETNLYLYTCNVKFDKAQFELEYESNLPPDETSLICTEEKVTKLNIKILRPNIQAKLQKGIDFFQQHPNYFSSAILFLRNINDLIDTRYCVVKKLYEFEKNLNVGVSKSTDQHSIIFKSELKNVEFLHIKWNFKWELRTCLARDWFTAKIIRTDDQLMVEIKPLVEKLCSDKFAFESSFEDKVNIFRNILIAIKDADTRDCSMLT